MRVSGNNNKHSGYHSPVPPDPWRWQKWKPNAAGTVRYGDMRIQNSECTLQRENNNQAQPTRNIIRPENPRNPSILYHHSGPWTNSLSQPLFAIHIRVCCTAPRLKAHLYMHQILRYLQHLTIVSPVVYAFMADALIRLEFLCCNKSFTSRATTLGIFRAFKS